MERKGKKIQYQYIQDYVIHKKKLNFACKIFFSKKNLFEYKNHFEVEKNTKKVLGQFQKYFEHFLSSPSKKC